MESRCDGDFQDVGPATQKSSPSLSFQIYKWSTNMTLPSSSPSPPPPQPTGWALTGPLCSKH